MSFKKAKKTQEKIERDYTKERNDRAIPIAKDLIKMIGDAEVLVGSTDSKTITKAYVPTTEGILKYMLEKEMRMDDLDYIFRLILEHFQRIEQFVKSSTGRSLDNATDKAWGKSVGELTMKDIDEKLREDTTE